MAEDPSVVGGTRLAALLRHLGEAAEREAAARSRLASSIGRVLSCRSSDPAALLQAVTSASAALDSALLLAERDGRWRVTAAVGGVTATPAGELELATGALAEALRGGEPSLLGAGDLPAPFLPEGTRSACAVPLLDRGARPFALAVFGSRTEHQLAGDDLLLARCGAERVARALEAAELDRALARAEESARRSAGFRDQILAIVGHDLRNPLGAVVMSAALLQKRGGLAGWQSKTVDRVRSSAARMGHIVDDLLGYTRARLGGGISIERAPADLGEIARRMVEELRAANPETRIDVAVCGDLRGEWDAARLEQAVSNLVSNAVDHGEAGHPIRVEVRAPRLRASGATLGINGPTLGMNGPALGVNEGVELSVQNRGEMPYEALQHAFEAFRRGPEQNGRKTSGLGLGLFIAREIVCRHGGEITASSADGTTRVVVRLPRRSVTAPRATCRP